jgi:sulfur carrier protein ThiS
MTTYVTQAKEEALQIDVRLFGILRDRVPNAKSGYLKIEMGNGNSVADLLAKLELSGRVGIAVNENVIEDNSQILISGDQIHLYTAIGGG